MEPLEQLPEIAAHLGEARHQLLDAVEQAHEIITGGVGEIAERGHGDRHLVDQRGDIAIVLGHQSEQTGEGWTVHEIDNAISQVHAIHLADINRDGLVDFVAGKRFWAHNGNDPGSYEPAVLCWFELQRDGKRCVWHKHVIDRDSGVGLHFQIIDVNRDGLLDVVTSNKKGVFLFEQRKS